MKFVASFGKGNTFSMDLRPVTNEEHVENILRNRGEPSERDAIEAYERPDHPHFGATFDKAKAMCVGGTVQFA